MDMDKNRKLSDKGIDSAARNGEKNKDKNENERKNANRETVYRSDAETDGRRGMNSDVISRQRKRKIQSKTGKLCALLVILLVIFILMIFTDTALRKPLRALAIGKVRAVSAEALNNAVLKVLDEYGFDKLCELNLQAGENCTGVYAMEINISAMNRIAASIAHEAQELIRRQGRLGLNIPLGTAAGIAFLTGRGPKIEVTFTPIGSVTSKISTKFSGAGINQTRYCAYLNLEAKVHVVLGTSQDTVIVNHTAALYETIIVGAVPETYTNIDSVDEALNLLPAN